MTDSKDTAPLSNDKPPAALVPLQQECLNRTVVGAGVTSALGDFCYETTAVILPGFLAIGHRKLLVLVGYALTPAG
ncbi:hypothetical protein [Cupriavidus metallidurans]|uniref:hypothetical protein n=1 Tax=Cupriavidus metallidurans TaxID=119219 RepID=UPI001D131815|nr:hypothetical protein [Cupriavidus metallidurans]